MIESQFWNHAVNDWLFRLIHRYSSVNFKKFAEAGIHPGQLPVLRAVHEKEGISLRELADQLHIKPPTVTVTVKRLEKNGFLYKRTDEKDLRIIRIYESEKGKKLAKDLQKVAMENERLLTQGFSEEEKKQICQYFQRMTENLIQAGVEICPMDIPDPPDPCTAEIPMEIPDSPSEM